MTAENMRSPPAAQTPRREDDKPRGDGGIGRAWRGLVRGLIKPRAGDELRETIDEIIETHGHEEEAPAPVSPHERVLLANLLKFRTLTAEDVCVPRADIVAVEATVSQPELLKVVVREAH